jgi:outer membrane autotransporter protein
VSNTLAGPDVNVPLVIAQGGGAETAFRLDRRYVAESNGRELALGHEAGAWSLDYAAVSPEVPALVGVDAAAILAGRASLESLLGRLAAIRADGAARRGGLWAQALWRRDRFDDILYKVARSETSCAQAGGDLVAGDGEGREIVFGLYYDHAKTDTRMAGGVSTAAAVSDGAVVYVNCKAGALRLDAAARVGRDRYEIAVPDTPRFGLRGASWAASLGAGWLFDAGATDWNLEPSARLTWQGRSVDEARDSFGRAFNLDAAESLEGRAGLACWQEFAWCGALRVKPRLSAAIVREFRGATLLRVGDPYDPRAATEYRNDFGGGHGELGAGFLMELGRGITLHGEALWHFGGKLGGHALNLGLGKTW